MREGEPRTLEAAPSWDWGMRPSEGLDNPPKALPPIPALSHCLVLGTGGLDPLRTAWASFTPRFLEFEAEEEMQMQKAQWMKGTQSLPPPAPPRLEPRGPPAPEVAKQPGTASHIPIGAMAKAKGAKGGHCPHTPCFPSRGGFAPQQDSFWECMLGTDLVNTYFVGGL